MRLGFKQTTIVTLCCLAFLAGLVVGRQQLMPVWPMLLLTIPALSRRWRRLAIIGLCLMLGMWRANASVRADQGLAGQFGHSVTLTGTVSDDPALSDTNQLSFNVAVDHFNGQPYRTQVTIYTYRLPLHRGYGVALVGKPKPTRGASQAQISFPALEITHTKLSWLERLRLRFFAAERTAIPEPLASFALGLLVGARALIPKSFQAQLSAVGLSHLVAVSGYNLTILVNGVRNLFRRSSKFFVFGISLWMIAGFVLVAGASASIVRAAVVSVLILAAGYYGRQIKPTVLIALAAVITAGGNPHSLWNDLGWQLSFAAFVGILMLGPALSQRFGGESNGALALVYEALSAYVLTLPLILHSFGTLGPIAPLVNILVMPLVPLAMLACFGAGLAALVMPIVSGWISWPATLLLRFMTGIIEQTSRLKPLNLQVSTGFMVAWYALIVIIIIMLTRQSKPQPSWYNKDKEGQSDVRTLKVA